jgi:hypothetical protein
MRTMLRNFQLVVLAFLLLFVSATAPAQRVAPLGIQSLEAEGVKPARIVVITDPVPRWSAICICRWPEARPWKSNFATTSTTFSPKRDSRRNRFYSTSVPRRCEGAVLGWMPRCGRMNGS